MKEVIYISLALLAGCTLQETPRMKQAAAYNRLIELNEKLLVEAKIQRYHPDNAERAAACRRFNALLPEQYEAADVVNNSFGGEAEKIQPFVEDYILLLEGKEPAAFRLNLDEINLESFDVEAPVRATPARPHESN